MVTVVPTEPLAGENPVIEGITIKFDDDVPVSPFTVTVIGPVVAPNGTVVIIFVLVELLTTASVPLKATELFSAVVSKFNPTIVTVVPTVPLGGEKLVVPTLVEPPQPDRIIRKRKVIEAILRCRNPFIACFLSGAQMP